MPPDTMAKTPRGPTGPSPNGQHPAADDDAERAVLGAIMASRGHIADAAHLTGPDFYKPGHEIIWRTLRTLIAGGHPTDPVALTTELTRRGDLAAAGGRPYVTDLYLDGGNYIPAQLGYYADIVHTYARARRLQTAGLRLTQLGQQAATDPDQIAQHLSQARTELDDLLTLEDTTRVASSWAAVDLAPILDSDEDITPRPTVLTRRDGPALLYPGYVHSVAGEPGCGKSFLAALAIAQEIEHGQDVAYLDFEDRPHSLIDRLRKMGADDKNIAAHVRYVRPDMALSDTSRPDLTTAVAGCALAIVDGITEAMTLHGLSLMDNEDIARWLELIPRRLADAGAAVLQIDHVVKNPDERGPWSIGGQHKLAGITGVAYKMLTIRPFGIGVKGTARLVIGKDRHGHVGPTGHTAAVFTMDSTDPTGRVFPWLDGAGADRGPEGEFRPTGYMEKVSRFLEAHPGSSGRAIDEGVLGKAEHIRNALTHLLTEGYARTETGSRRAVLNYSEKPFREDEQ